MFKNCKSGVLEHLRHSMELKKFSLGQYVYEEEYSPADGVYFIESGEIEVLQNKFEEKHDPSAEESYEFRKHQVIGK